MNSLFARASAGDAAAQFEMAKRALAFGSNGANPPGLAALEALHWMRQAEANGYLGDDVRDVRRIIPGLLLVIGGHAEDEGQSGAAAPYLAEALARLRSLADEGGETGESDFWMVHNIVSPAVHILADQIYEGVLS